MLLRSIVTAFLKRSYIAEIQGFSDLLVNIHSLNFIILLDFCFHFLDGKRNYNTNFKT